MQWSRLILITIKYITLAITISSYLATCIALLLHIHSYSYIGDNDVHYFLYICMNVSLIIIMIKSTKVTALGYAHYSIAT